MGKINHPIVGQVSYTVNRDGSLNLLDDWASRNIGVVLIPELVGVPTYGGRFSGKVSFYRRAIPQLKAAFVEVGRRGLKDKILFWDGSFVPRLMRGGNSPSNHSFGTAFDINAEWNGFHKRPAAVGAKGDLHAISAVFKRHGFEWGGDWRDPDGMHIEVAKIVSEAGAQSTPDYPKIAVPEYSGPGFEIVQNGVNIGEGLIWNGKLFGALDASLEAAGLDIVKSADLRGRREQPRFYVITGKKAK